MQLSDIRDEVRLRCGIAATDGLATDEDLTTIVNSALRYVSALRDWPWLVATESFSTVVGQTEYTPSDSDWRTTIRLEIPEHDFPLTHRTPRQVAKFLNHEGPYPVIYYVERGKIILAPKPTQVVTVKHVYLINETPLDSDSDEPLCPDYAIDLVIIKAAKTLAPRIRDNTLMRQLQGEWEEAVGSLLDEVNRSRGSVIPSHRTDWTV